MRLSNVIHVPSLTFQGLLIKKKVRPLTLIVLVSGRIFKKFKKYVEKIFKNNYFLFMTNINIRNICYSGGGNVMCAGVHIIPFSIPIGIDKFKRNGGKFFKWGQIVLKE